MTKTAATRCTSGRVLMICRAGPDGVGIILADACHKTVRIPHVDHHGAKIIGIQHLLAGLLRVTPPRAPQAIEFLHVSLKMRGLRRIHHLRTHVLQAQFLQPLSQ